MVINDHKNTKLAEKLKELREAHNLKQIDIAAAIDVRQATYSQYETEKRTPSSIILFRIASFYGISVDDLLRLCIELDNNIYFDAPAVSANGRETAEYLSFSQIERYSPLSKNEKRLLFYFSKLNPLAKDEVIDYSRYKYQYRDA